MIENMSLITSNSTTTDSSNSTMMMMINIHDVLLGRGGQTNNHIGNREYRRIVYEHQNVYLHARKKEKALIAQQIVRTVHANGGRFLKKDMSDVWVEVPLAKAIAKTSQALREGLDVRNMTIRPNKIFRCSLEDHPQGGSNGTIPTRGRVVAGKVLTQGPNSPYSSLSVVSVDNLDGHSLPDLQHEQDDPARATAAAATPLLRYQPDLSKNALDDFCEV